MILQNNLGGVHPSGPISVPYYWEGNYSCEWNNPLNWLNRALPNSDSTVIILPSKKYYPRLKGKYMVNKIVIREHTMLTITKHSTLLLKGEKKNYALVCKGNIYNMGSIRTLQGNHSAVFTATAVLLSQKGRLLLHKPYLRKKGACLLQT